MRSCSEIQRTEKTFAPLSNIFRSYHQSNVDHFAFPNQEIPITYQNPLLIKPQEVRRVDLGRLSPPSHFPEETSRYQTRVIPNKNSQNRGGTRPFFNAEITGNAQISDRFGLAEAEDFTKPVQRTDTSVRGAPFMRNSHTIQLIPRPVQGGGHTKLGQKRPPFMQDPNVVLGKPGMQENGQNNRFIFPENEDNSDISFPPSDGFQDSNNQNLDIWPIDRNSNRSGVDSSKRESTIHEIERPSQSLLNPQDPSKYEGISRITVNQNEPHIQPSLGSNGPSKNNVIRQTTIVENEPPIQPLLRPQVSSSKNIANTETEIPSFNRNDNAQKENKFINRPTNGHQIISSRTQQSEIKKHRRIKTRLSNSRVEGRPRPTASERHNKNRAKSQTEEVVKTPKERNQDNSPPVREGFEIDDKSANSKMSQPTDAEDNDHIVPLTHLMQSVTSSRGKYRPNRRRPQLLENDSANAGSKRRPNISSKAGEVITPTRQLKIPSHRDFHYRTRKKNHNLHNPRLKLDPTHYNPQMFNTLMEEVETTLPSTTFVRDPPASDIFPHTTVDHWFLMPVQGWFALSIVFLAVIFLLLVICSILYTRWRRNKRMMMNLLSTKFSYSHGVCNDPIHHRRCLCKSGNSIAMSAMAGAPVPTIFQRASISGPYPLERGRSSGYGAHRSSFKGPEPVFSRSDSRRYSKRSCATMAQDEPVSKYMFPSSRIMTEKEDNFDSIATVQTQIDSDFLPSMGEKPFLSKVNRNLSSESDDRTSSDKNNFSDTTQYPHQYIKNNNNASNKCNRNKSNLKNNCRNNYNKNNGNSNNMTKTNNKLIESYNDEIADQRMSLKHNNRRTQIKERKLNEENDNGNGTENGIYKALNDDESNLQRRNVRRSISMTTNVPGAAVGPGGDANACSHTQSVEGLLRRQSSFRRSKPRKSSSFKSNICPPPTKFDG